MSGEGEERGRIAISGAGLLAPGASSAAALFEAALRGESRIGPIRRFDASAYPSALAAEIADLPPGPFGRRLLKKLDRFSHLALLAAHAALGEAGADLERLDRSRVGLFVGNALGGWQFAEENLRAFHRGGLREVSPYMATAWFPAAPQGQISIALGLKGYAKTVVADRISSLVAIGYAARAIREGRVDAALAGGAEAPITPYALLCCTTSGELAPGRNGEGHPYLPYDAEARGYVLGEGACLLWLESEASARARGAPVLGWIAGFATARDAPGGARGEGLARAVGLALAQAGAGPRDVAAVYAEGSALPPEDVAEDRALGWALGSNGGARPPVTAPRSGFGCLLGAAGAIDAALALGTLRDGLVPPIVGTRRIAPGIGCDYVLGAPRVARGPLVLVCGRGKRGTAAALLLAGEGP